MGSFVYQILGLALLLNAVTTSLAGVVPRSHGTDSLGDRYKFERGANTPNYWNERELKTKYILNDQDEISAYQRWRQFITKEMLITYQKLKDKHDIDLISTLENDLLEPLPRAPPPKLHHHASISYQKRSKLHPTPDGHRHQKRSQLIRRSSGPLKPRALTNPKSRPVSPAPKSSTPKPKVSTSSSSRSTSPAPGSSSPKPKGSTSSGSRSTSPAPAPAPKSPSSPKAGSTGTETSDLVFEVLTETWKSHPFGNFERATERTGTKTGNCFDFAQAFDEVLKKTPGAREKIGETTFLAHDGHGNAKVGEYVVDSGVFKPMKLDVTKKVIYFEVGNNGIPVEITQRPSTTVPLANAVYEFVKTAKGWDAYHWIKKSNNRVQMMPTTATEYDAMAQKNVDSHLDPKKKKGAALFLFRTVDNGALGFGPMIKLGLNGKLKGKLVVPGSDKAPQTVDVKKDTEAAIKAQYSRMGAIIKTYDPKGKQWTPDTTKCFNKLLTDVEAKVLFS